MKILVCLEQILDPDIPARDFRIDPEKKEAVRGGATLVPNIFCENALETALQFRDRCGGHITCSAKAPPRPIRSPSPASWPPPHGSSEALTW